MKLDTIECANAPDYLRSLPDACAAAVITDPLYPEIERPYGRITEAEWMTLMQSVVSESRRVLKPTGSAVFVLQPNMKTAGTMRLWLWKFLVWCGEYWNVIQDVYWWNYTAMPDIAARSKMFRASVKYCVWVGNADCHRNQDDILITANMQALASKKADNVSRSYPSRAHVRHKQVYEKVQERGGATPFNLIPLTNTNSQSSAGAHGHGAGTPAKLLSMWIRYLTRRGETVIDPFMGSGTTALVAKSLDRHYLGCDKMQAYVDTANQRLKEASENHQTVMW